MTKDELIEFFDTIEKLEKFGATVEVEFDLDHDEFINSRLEKIYSMVDKDVNGGFVTYFINTNSRI